MSSVKDPRTAAQTHAHTHAHASPPVPSHVTSMVAATVMVMDAMRSAPVVYSRLAVLVVAVLAIDMPAIFLPAVLLSYLYDLIVFDLALDPYANRSSFGVGLEDFTLKVVTPALIAYLVKLVQHHVLSRALLFFLMLEVLTLALAPRARPGRRTDTRFAVD